MIDIISVILLKITLRLCCFLNLVSLIDIGDNLNIKTYNLLHLQQINKSILLHTTLRVFKLISSHAIRHISFYILYLGTLYVLKILITMHIFLKFAKCINFSHEHEIVCSTKQHYGVVKLHPHDSLLYTIR